MAVTATVALVSAASVEPARPPLSGAGWNNPYGDPEWIKDIDWYRRYQLRCIGSAGEVGGIVNWELFDGTIPVKTNADLTTATAGAVASPYGAMINNSDTWSVWVSTGVATAAQPKYRDTKQSPLVTLRANGPSVQLLLGPARKIGDPAVTWSIFAFLPGGGKTPAASATQVVQNRAPFAQATTVSIAGTNTITTAGGSTTLTATVAPAGAFQKVSWSNTGAGVTANLTATGDLTCTVTAMKNGTAQIFAQALSNPPVNSTGTTVTITGQAALLSVEEQAADEESEEKPTKEEKEAAKEEAKAEKEAEKAEAKAEREAEKAEKEADKDPVDPGYGVDVGSVPEPEPKTVPRKKAAKK